MKVLLVKLSSMGDLIHTLPALNDAIQAMPKLQFDWVVDNAFTEIASWHPSINQVITSNHRQWRKKKWQSIKNGDISHFLKMLRASHYDLIIDAQSSIKSAIISRLAHGTRCGLDRQCARESIASIFYQKKYHIAKQQHAIKRIRLLFAQALGYEYQDTLPNFTINRSKLIAPNIALPKQYLVFVHHASYPSKLWPNDYWHTLIEHAKADGYDVLLSCGNQQEQQRGEHLAASHTNAIALPIMPLSEIAYILAKAAGAICCDTGLSHIANALGTLSVSLYGPTDPGNVGTVGPRQIALMSDFSCNKCYKKTCFYTGKSEQTPACFTRLPPAFVWQQFHQLHDRCQEKQ